MAQNGGARDSIFDAGGLPAPSEEKIHDDDAPRAEGLLEGDVQEDGQEGARRRPPREQQERQDRDQDQRGEQEPLLAASQREGVPREQEQEEQQQKEQEQKQKRLNDLAESRNDFLFLLRTTESVSVVIATFLWGIVLLGAAPDVSLERSESKA